MSANLPPLTRAMVAVLVSGDIADSLVGVHVMGWELAPNPRYFLRDGGHALLEDNRFSADLNATARMEQRLLELGQAENYAEAIDETLEEQEKFDYLKFIFLAATAPALLRVKAALLLFCEE